MVGVAGNGDRDEERAARALLDMPATLPRNGDMHGSGFRGITERGRDRTQRDGRRKHVPVSVGKQRADLLNECGAFEDRDKLFSGFSRLVTHLNRQMEAAVRRQGP